VAAQIQAEVRSQVQPQAEAVVLAAPVITETPVVATPYTSVASEERVVEFTPPPQVAAPVAPVAPQPLVLPDGLDQIETDTEKLRSAASKVAPPAPPRPPRVRPVLPVISNEPLVQVETGR
jgi:ribonuclease E